jgi:hypothetical protein
MLQQLAVHLKASSVDEQTFRNQLRADPRLRVYADAEFPELRFFVGRAEAISLDALDQAEPVYMNYDKLDDPLRS